MYVIHIGNIPYSFFVFSEVKIIQRLEYFGRIKSIYWISNMSHYFDVIDT